MVHSMSHTVICHWNQDYISVLEDSKQESKCINHLLQKKKNFKALSTKKFNLKHKQLSKLDEKLQNKNDQETKFTTYGSVHFYNPSFQADALSLSHGPFPNLSTPWWCLSQAQSFAEQLCSSCLVTAGAFDQYALWSYLTLNPANVKNMVPLDTHSLFNICTVKCILQRSDIEQTVLPAF